MKKQISSFIYLYILARLLALPSSGWGSSGTEGASFLNIPVGARPAAMGSAYSALSVDAYAPVWNPAGLGFLESNEAAGQHLSYLESVNYEFLSFVHPLATRAGSMMRGAIGGSAQYLGTGSIGGTNAAGDSTGDFSAHYGSYNLAYGQALTDRLALGATMKWINAKIADVSANAFAFDFGSLYQATRRLMLGLTLSNVGTQLKFISDGNSLPLALRLGTAFQLMPQLLVSSDLEYRKTGMAGWHGGMEWTPLPSIALRVGYRTDTLKGLSALAGLSTGIGLKAWGYEFGYAWVPYGDLGNTQYFTLNYRFGQAAEKKRNLIQYRTNQDPQVVQNASDPAYAELDDLLSESPKHLAEAGKE